MTDHQDKNISPVSFEWVEATQTNLPDQEGKYLVKTSAQWKSSGKTEYRNTIETRMFISEKGEKTFDVSNQTVTHFLKQSTNVG